MTEYQLRILIWDTFCNSTKLRTMDISLRELGEVQDTAIKMAKLSGLLTELE
mgnify:CR=1 FL=1